MYPVLYEADHVERRSRLTTFFRLITMLPAAVLTWLYVLAAHVVVFIAWFVLLATGRYPQGMYDFVSGALRNATRLNAYASLLTDAYPPWNGSDDPGYPIRVRVAPPKERYSRVKVLFRAILAIPVAIIAYIYQLIMELGAFVAWFVIVVTGRQPEGIQNLINMGLRYVTQATAYYWLLTEDWPPITVDPAAVGMVPSGPENPSPPGSSPGAGQPVTPER